jgi:hypothetical protein
VFSGFRAPFQPTGILAPAAGLGFLSPLALLAQITSLSGSFLVKLGTGTLQSIRAFGVTGPPSCITFCSHEGVELSTHVRYCTNVLVPDEAFTLSLFHHSSCSAIIDPLAVCIDILNRSASCILLSLQPHPEDLLAIIVPFFVAIDEVWITLLLLESS